MSFEITKAIGCDTPLRLDVAAKIAFPRSGMSASGLRREAKRGRLVIERVAGKDYTTLNHINRMRELCRVKQSDRDCGYDQHAEVRVQSIKSRSLTFSTSTCVTLCRSTPIPRRRFAG